MARPRHSRAKTNIVSVFRDNRDIVQISGCHDFYFVISWSSDRRSLVSASSVAPIPKNSWPRRRLFRPGSAASPGNHRRTNSLSSRGFEPRKSPDLRRRRPSAYWNWQPASDAKLTAKRPLSKQEVTESSIEPAPSASASSSSPVPLRAFLRRRRIDLSRKADRFPPLRRHGQNSRRRIVARLNRGWCSDRISELSIFQVSLLRILARKDRLSHEALGRNRQTRSARDLFRQSLGNT